jgi:hypothetical protein
MCDGLEEPIREVPNESRSDKPRLQRVRLDFFTRSNTSYAELKSGIGQVFVFSGRAFVRLVGKELTINAMFQSRNK